MQFKIDALTHSLIGVEFQPLYDRLRAPPSQNQIKKTLKTELITFIMQMCELSFLQVSRLITVCQWIFAKENGPL